MGSITVITCFGEVSRVLLLVYVGVWGNIAQVDCFSCGIYIYILVLPLAGFLLHIVVSFNGLFAWAYNRNTRVPNVLVVIFAPYFCAALAG